MAPSCNKHGYTYIYIYILIQCPEPRVLSWGGWWCGCLGETQVYMGTGTEGGVFFRGTIDTRQRNIYSWEYSFKPDAIPKSKPSSNPMIYHTRPMFVFLKGDHSWVVNHHSNHWPWPPKAINSYTSRGRVQPFSILFVFFISILWTPSLLLKSLPEYCFWFIDICCLCRCH